MADNGHPSLSINIALIAEGPSGRGTPLVTPRYEPAWFYDEIPPELISQCLRPRRRESLDTETRDWLYRQLMTFGHAANAAGHHFMAHAWFECGFCTKDDISSFISSVNMRLRLGQHSLAAKLYEQLLGTKLTEAQGLVVNRKLKEATQAKTSRSHVTKPATFPQDEVAQVLTAAALVEMQEGDLERLIRLLRRHGHAANEADDFEAAHLWFDCAVTISQQLADLLSAANMRVKLQDTSPAAEALYRHVLSEPESGEREQAMAERKLASMQELKNRAAASVEYGEMY